MAGGEQRETADMTTISLAADEFDMGDRASATTGDNRRIVENLRRALDEKDAEIKQLVDESAGLNDKVKRLHRDAIEQDRRLEALDRQHADEMDSVLGMRSELQAKIITLDAGLQAARLERAEVDARFERLYGDHSDLLAANQQLVARFDDIEAKYAECAAELERLQAVVDDAQTQLSSKSMEVVELSALLEEREAHSRDGSDKFEMIDKLSNSSEVNRLQTELDEINDKLAVLNDIKHQYDENVARLGTVAAEKARTEEQLAAVQAANGELLEEIRVTRESVEKLELLQKNLDEINAEKEHNEMAFSALQEDDLLLQREFDQLKADKDKLATELESAKCTQDEQIDVLQRKCAELEAIVNQVSGEHEALKADHATRARELAELQASNDALRAECTDAEARLTEASKYQAQVIDLQSALNSKNATTQADASGGAITFDELKALLAHHLNYKSTDDSMKSYVDVFLGSVRDCYQHLADIETNRSDLMKQFECVSSEKATLQHEYRTLKADLHHYEKEVAELMKNNGILLNELENAKSGKLETISEQNEDNILRLETQLEDSGKLNRSLQDEYDNSLRLLEENEEEKCELAEKVAALEAQLRQKATTIAELQQHVDDAELARQNVQTQLDGQAEGGGATADVRQEFDERDRRQRSEIEALTKQLANLNTDHADLVHKLADLQEEKQKLVGQCEKLKASHATEDEIVARLQQELSAANERLLQAQVDKDEQCKEQMGRIEELCQALGVLRGQVELSAEYKTRSLADLQQQLDKSAHEKQELIAAIQLKHNENVQYHAKIQELNQMLIGLQQTVTAQSHQLQHCETCVQLNQQLSAATDELARVSDQVAFLKEKSDIMTKNLLIEQNNQKLVHQEKVQLQADKESLARDLMRLREHLIEMENGNTNGMIELQNLLAMTQQELTAMQEEARKSNTAYTSAR